MEVRLLPPEPIDASVPDAPAASAVATETVSEHHLEGSVPYTAGARVETHRRAVPFIGEDPYLIAPAFATEPLEFLYERASDAVASRLLCHADLVEEELCRLVGMEYLDR